MDDRETPVEGTISVCGSEYAFKRWGDPEAPPILALHGWLDNANSFDFVGSELSKQHRLVALDFLGHGHSSHLPPWHFYHYADVLAHMSELVSLWSSSEPLTIVGHSLGGAIAVCLAAMFPDKVKAVVTIDALGPLVSGLESLPESMAAAALARGKWQQREPRVMPSFAHAVQLRLKSEWSITPAAAERLCERGTQVTADGYIWRADPRWKAPSVLRFCEAQVQAILRKVTCPCYLAVAEAGLLEKMSGYEARKACVPNLREKVFRGGHHLHMEEDAESFARWVSQEVLNVD